MAHHLVRLSHDTNTPHLASALSCIHILAHLYWREMNIQHVESDDIFIMSKGHAVAAHYTALAYRGFFPIDELASLGADDSRLEEHPGIHAPPGVKVVSGSLGHGLSIGVGLAYAAKMKKTSQKVFVLMGDGEQNEGQVWEAAQHAPTLGLDNLHIIVDCNKWQGTGRSSEITSLEPLDDKWRAFGWECVRAPGNDLDSLASAFAALEKSSKPKALVADTVKGWGISFMEDDNNWHYRLPTQEEVALAATELGLL